MLVQYLLPEGSVEALDERILIGLARLDVLHRYPLVAQPLHKRLAQELRTVVRANDLRQPMQTLQLFETSMGHPPLAAALPLIPDIGWDTHLCPTRGWDTHLPEVLVSSCYLMSPMKIG